MLAMEKSFGRISLKRNTQETFVRLISLNNILNCRLKFELEDNSTTVIVHVEWTVSRKTYAKDASEVTTKLRDIQLPPFVNGEFNPVRLKLADMLSTNDSTIHSGNITLLNAFPKFLKVTSLTTDVVPQLMHFSK